MQHHLDEAAFDACDDLVKRGAQNALARSGTRCRMQPGTLALAAASTPSGFKARRTSLPTA
jgi:hypothetical protein